MLVRDSLASLFLVSRVVFLLLTVGVIPSAVSSATLEELAAPCLACHSLEPDGASHVGPTLANIRGRLLGSDETFTYSEAFVAKAAEAIVWNRQTLDVFLSDPAAMVEGTAMSFPGVPDTRQRELLLDWLVSDPTGKVTDLSGADFSRDPQVMEILKLAADTEYGVYLAGECLTCHQSGDSSGRVPPIHKLTRDYFIYVLLEYQNGARSNRVMQNVAAALGAEEIAALSAVFTGHSPLLK